MTLTRRALMGYGAAGLGLGLTGLPVKVSAAGDELVIAYNVNLPSFDPTVGPSAVNPTIQGIYQSIFDQYIGQNPDLSFRPGLLTEWGWTDDKKQVKMTVRKGATWHDGSPVTPEDVVWSLERAGQAWYVSPEGGEQQCSSFDTTVVAEGAPTFFRAVDCTCTMPSPSTFRCGTIDNTFVSTSRVSPT